MRKKNILYIYGKIESKIYYFILFKMEHTLYITIRNTVSHQICNKIKNYSNKLKYARTFKSYVAIPRYLGPKVYIPLVARMHSHVVGRGKAGGGRLQGRTAIPATWARHTPVSCLPSGIYNTHH